MAQRWTWSCLLTWHPSPPINCWWFYAFEWLSLGYASNWLESQPSFRPSIWIYLPSDNHIEAFSLLYFVFFNKYWTFSNTILFIFKDFRILMFTFFCVGPSFVEHYFFRALLFSPHVSLIETSFEVHYITGKKNIECRLYCFGNINDWRLNYYIVWVI
jgi:hypothetical protein